MFLFGESGTNQTMKLWRFFANADTVRMPDTAFVDSASVFVGVPHPDTLANDLFCNGHSVLPDGRMVFIGGNYQPRNACETVYTFDPAWLSGAAWSPWTTDATMAAERWYATATALADGRILAAAGEARSWLGAFGGHIASDSSDRKWRSLAFAARYHWGDTTAVPANNNPPPNPVTRVRHDDYTAGKFPPAREDHAFAGIPVGTGVLFGGRQVLLGADTTWGDAWLLQASPLQNDSVMTWIRLHQVDTDTSVGVPEVIPSPRTRAAMVWAGINWADPNTNLPGARDSLKCFLFGGRDSLGHALGDLWMGKLRTVPAVYQSPIGMTQDWQWTKLLPDAAERRRFGHTMWFDPGDGGAGAPYARLVIFGGLVGDSTLASNKIYTYGVGSDPAVAAVWDSLTPAADTTWGSPQARQGHMATHKRPVGDGEARKFYFTGGQNARGNLLPPEAGHSEANDTHVWALTRSDNTAASPNYAWDWVAWSAPTGFPLARARAAIAYDSWSKRLVMLGGDLNGDGQPGGLTDSVWCIQVESYGGGGVLNKWFQPMQRSMGFPSMPATSRHILFAYGDAGYINESSMEAYSSAGSSPSCSPWSSPQGTWQTITSQNPESQRAISAYPYLFLLPDGRLFNAGPSPGDRIDQPYRRFYNFGTNQWADDIGAHETDAAVMGSAAMYRPGKVLRAGTHAPGDRATAHDRTETIEIGSGATPAWVEYEPDFDATWPLAARLNHNLTVLPTGDVLATGGVTDLLPPEGAGTAVRRPQLWRVSSSGWNAPADSLREDPKTRNYHSTALLLPDGRVMTAGGEVPNNDRTTVSIYEPPYLFSGNGYARRPVIADGPEVLRYGEPFTLKIGAAADTTDVDSIRSVALLRPSAVTHGFDQNQRFVPLGFQPRHGHYRLLAWAPPDSFIAPPGAYMMFVTRGRGNSRDSVPVPSLAKWVVLQRPTGVQADSMDFTSPRGGTGFNLATLPCETGTEAPLAMHLSWTAPADDDSIAYSGKARSYNLRWIPNSGSLPPFNMWTSIATGAPNVALTAENAVASPVTSGIWYRFGLKAVGDNADTSSLGELVATRVQCSGGSSGGGGGEHEDPRMRKAGGTSQRPGVSVPPDENTLLAGVALGTRTLDVLRLTRAPGISSGMRRAFVRQGQDRGLLVDGARLLVVDHPVGTEVVAPSGGVLLTGTPSAAPAVSDRQDRDVTAAATGAAPEPLYADSGEVLTVTLPSQSELAPRTVLFDLMGGGDDTGAIEVEVEAPGGSWQPAASIHPRLKWSAHALSLAAATRLRLTFRGAYALRFAGELVGAAPAAVQSASLIAAESNHSGDAFDEARAAVDTSLAMVAGDTLSLLFADVPAAAEGAARSWLLEVEGTPVTPHAAQALARHRESELPVGAPLAFALHPSAPNPTHGTVRLGFDLPMRTSVRLEIFDAQGRRVRRFDAELAAGRHAFDWDLNHASGPRVAPGIYTYRLTAGRDRAQNKLVVLP